MAAFNYQALDHKGRIKKGVQEADSPRQLRALLREKNLKPLNIEQPQSPATSSASAKQKSSTHGAKAWGSSGYFGPRLKPKQLALFTRQLATLLDSGLPLSEALSSCAKQQYNQRQQHLILQIRSRIMEGYSLADALNLYPGSFDQLYRSTIAAGEQAGFLAKVVTRLAEHCEASQENQQQLQSAMIYPGFLLLISVAIVSLLMTKVVPDMVSMFTRRGQQLPLLTEWLIICSDFLVAYGLWLLLAIPALAFFKHWYLSNEKRRRNWHRRYLQLPLIGRWEQNIDSSRFANTLAIMVGSGVPLLQSLAITQAVIGNQHIRLRCELLLKQVREGSSLYRAMDNSNVFPPMLVQMVASGEASGQLESMLGRAASYQERELNQQLTALGSILPGLMVVIMGILVGLIVMAILLPIFAQSQLI